MSLKSNVSSFTILSSSALNSTFIAYVASFLFNSDFFYETGNIRFID